VTAPGGVQASRNEAFAPGAGVEYVVPCLTSGRYDQSAEIAALLA
jgi:hypothetical protein